MPTRLFSYYLIALFWLSILGSTTHAKTHRPFGHHPSNTLPTEAKRITIFNEKIGFEADQVCGYNDWSSSILHFPKEIMSGEYWTQVWDNAYKLFLQTAYSISGALPQVILCNISPTFCSILNTAQMLGQANLGITMDSCSMLEDIATSDYLIPDDSELAKCMKKPENKKLPAGKRREVCIEKLSGEELDKYVFKPLKPLFDQVGPISDYVPSWVEKSCMDRSTSNQTSGELTETQKTLACTFRSKDSFLGMRISGGVSLRASGTFFPTFESQKQQNQAEISKLLMAILAEMHDLYHKNLLPDDKVIVHPSVNNYVYGGIDYTKNDFSVPNKIAGWCVNSSHEQIANCEPDISKVPPIWKLTAPDRFPVLMVSPGSLIEFVKVMPSSWDRSFFTTNKDGIATKMPFRYLSTIEPLSFSINTQSMVYRSNKIQELTTKCLTTPGVTKPEAKQCELFSKEIDQIKDSLLKDQDAYMHQIEAQKLMYNEVDRLKSENVPHDNSEVFPRPTKTNKIPHPGDL